MGLNIVSAGSYDPWIKYNSKSGRFFVKGDVDDVEVTPTNFVADFANIKTGWITFTAGGAPVRVWDKDLSTQAAKPSEDSKRGFSVRLYAKTFGVKELSSNSMHICNAINDLYTAYEEQLKANPGMVPVVKFTGNATMKDPKGVNYKPNFVIEKWMARPAELDAPVAAQSAPSAPSPVAASANEF